MTTSPTLTTHFLAESDLRQHAFPHSLTNSEEEMEEKEHVNQNLHLIFDSEQRLFPVRRSALRIPAASATQPAPKRRDL